MKNEDRSSIDCHLPHVRVCDDRLCRGTPGNQYQGANFLGTATPAAPSLAAYEGTYKLPPFDLVVTSEGGKLFGTPSGQPMRELTADGADRYVVSGLGAKIAFVRAPDGTVSSMVLEHRGKSLSGDKAK